LTEAPWRYRALYPGTSLMLAIAEGLHGQRSGRPPALPRFTEAVLRDDEGARRLRRFHLASEDPRATLLRREELLVGALAWLVGHHAARQQSWEPPLRPEPRLAGTRARTVRTVREYLDEHASENVSLTALAQLAGVSPCHLCRAFHREVGMPPHAYQTQLRVREAKRLLSDGMPVALSAATAGFYDQAHLTRHFRRIVGVTPGAYLRAKSC